MVSIFRVLGHGQLLSRCCRCAVHDSSVDETQAFAEARSMPRCRFWTNMLKHDRASTSLAITDKAKIEKSDWNEDGKMMRRMKKYA